MGGLNLQNNKKNNMSKIESLALITNRNSNILVLYEGASRTFEQSDKKIAYLKYVSVAQQSLDATRTVGVRLRALHNGLW